MRRVVLVLSLVFMVLGLAACGATSSTQTFKATLNGVNERPNPVTTGGTGTVTLELKDKVMTLTGDFTGLSGPATAAHIHGPAPESGVAGVVFPLTATAAASGTLTLTAGSVTLSDAQIVDLKAGQWYVNVHTAANQAGEIRGQLK